MISPQPAAAPPPSLPRSARIVAVLIILIAFAASLAWSHVKCFWIDELLEFYSDERMSGLAVLRGQMHHPFSLEPPLYHLLLHYSFRLFPHHELLAGRMPAMLLFALLQWCLLRLVLRLTGNWGSALLAATIPLALPTFLFSPEARVYSLLTCMFAVALLAYCKALQSHGGQRRRAYVLLAAALSVAMISHYYGIFEPVPFVVAEAVRSFRNRRAELAPWIALFVSFASFALNLPFLAGLHTVGAYYGPELQAWDKIPFTYIWLFGQNDVYALNFHGDLVRGLAYACLYGLLPLAIVSLAMRRWRDAPTFADNVNRNAVLLTTHIGLLIPIMTVTVAHLVTHAYWPRYSVETVVPIAVVLSVAAAPTLRGWYGTSYALALVLTLAAIVIYGHAYQDNRTRLAQEATALATPDLLQAEHTLADPHIYLQQVGQLLTLNKFAPPDQSRRLVEFDSPERAAFYNMHTPATSFAENVAASTSLPFVSYEQLRRMPGPHLVLTFDDPVEAWIDRELKRPGATVSIIPKGKAFTGQIYLVTFTPAG